MVDATPMHAVGDFFVIVVSRAGDALQCLQSGWFSSSRTMSENHQGWNTIPIMIFVSMRVSVSQEISSPTVGDRDTGE